MRERDDSAPLLIVTGEEIPTGGDFAESGLDRMFIINTSAGGIMRRVTGKDGKSDRGAGALESLYSRLEKFPIVTAAYVQWLAKHMADEFAEDDPARARDAMAKFVETQTEQALVALNDYPGFEDATMTTRAKITAARLLMGLENLIDFAIDIGAVTPEQQETIVWGARDQIAEQAMSINESVMDSNLDDAQVVISRVQSLIAQGRATLDDEPRAGVVRVGKVIQAKVGETRHDVVCLIPDAVAALLRWPTGEKGIERALVPALLPGAANSGKYRRNVKFGSSQARGLCVMKHVWDGELTDDGGDGNLGPDGF